MAAVYGLCADLAAVIRRFKRMQRMQELNAPEVLINECRMSIEKSLASLVTRFPVDEESWLDSEDVYAVLRLTLLDDPDSLPN